MRSSFALILFCCSFLLVCKLNEAAETPDTTRKWHRGGGEIVKVYISILWANILIFVFKFSFETAKSSPNETMYGESSLLLFLWGNKYGGGFVMPIMYANCCKTINNFFPHVWYNFTVGYRSCDEGAFIIHRYIMFTTHIFKYIQLSEPCELQHAANSEHLSANQTLKSNTI